jgi:hypothetical protein
MNPAADDRQLLRRLVRDARAAAKADLPSQVTHDQVVRRQALVAVVAGLASFPLQDLWGSAAGGIAFFSGLAALHGVTVRRRPPVRPMAALPVVPVPPAATSAAFPAVRRLEAVREELCRLLPLVAPAGRVAAEQAWQAAAEADSALRWQAARLAAVEPHRGLEPELMRMLEEGVGSQERLVVAVADLVAASGDPLASSRLQDATDRLHGLAQGLREVR